MKSNIYSSLRQNETKKAVGKLNVISATLSMFLLFAVIIFVQ
jgi:hypothetical protein